MPIVSGHLEPISASATDSTFGVISLTLTLTNGAGESEILEQITQECEKGACPLSADFEDIDMSEKPVGPYTLTVEAEDGAGNTSEESRDFKLDPKPPEIELSGLLAERDGQALEASSGELEILANDTNVAVSGVQALNVERDYQRVASYPSDCSEDCAEAEATYRYSALRDGAKRELRASAEPAGATLTRLSGVSCVSADDCHAVGHYRDGSGATVALAERWDGESWEVEASPTPEGALESRLESIDCSSSSNCLAVGHYKTGAEAFATLALHWDGSEWAIVSTPNPGGAVQAYLRDVECPAPADCWAVGESVDEAEEPAALIEHWSGGEWTLVAAPEVAALKSLSCASVGSCAAVTGLEGLDIARWDGSEWAQETAAAPPAGGSESRLSDIACVAEGECGAVGSYSAGGHTAPLVQRWDGSQWSAQAAVDPVGLIPEAEMGTLDAIDCPTADSCTAFGVTGRPLEAAPLVESWDGVDWALQPGPAPLEATAMTAEAISCHGQYACTLVGSSKRSGETSAFIETETPSEEGQVVTVEAVDRYGNSKSESIEVDVHEEPGETPECSQETTTVEPEGVVSATEAKNKIEEAVPTAVAASDPTTEEITEEVIDPSYSAPEPDLENTGNRAEGETSVTPEGGFTLDGIACITPAATTSAATEATVVNGDAAVFANTAPETDTVIRPSAGGTTVVQSLRGENAPASFSWNITVTEEEEVTQLASGALAITEPSEDEGEASEIPAPEGLETPASLNDAQLQLENGYHELASAQGETADTVVAVIPSPWVVLDQGGVVPVEKVELKVTEIPTEYNVTYTLPPFEINFDPMPIAVSMEATVSSVANGHCPPNASPCGRFDADRAASYARYWGSGRNPKFEDFGSNDCTNFISQVMRAGRMKFMRAFDSEADEAWWYKNTDPWLPIILDDYEATPTWTLANELPRHLWRFGLAHIDPVQQPWGWTKGGIVATDWFGSNGQGDINHLFFVVGNHHHANRGREPHLASHSSASYANLPWYVVRKRIQESEGESGWTRFALAVKHTDAHPNAKKHTPENLYNANGLFHG